MLWSKRSTRNALIFVTGVVVLFGGGYAVLRMLASAMFPPTTTDVGCYGDVLKERSSSGLVAHFPPTTPAGAKNVRFSAYPGFLQAAAHVQLRIQLPAGEIEQIDSQFKQTALHVYSGGGFFDHYNRDQKAYVPTAHFHTADNPKASLDFPDHYTLYVLEATDRSSGSWNHGRTRGVAVSAKASEAVYWAESW